jgi:uncharacterized membrane protein
MTVHQIGLVKLSALGTAVISAVVTTVVDPSVKVAIITGIAFVSAAFVTALASIIIQIMNYRLAKLSLVTQHETHEVMTKVQTQTDGIFSRLFNKTEYQSSQLEAQGSQLADATQKLSAAEGFEKGRQVGVESEIHRLPEK